MEDAHQKQQQQSQAIANLQNTIAGLQQILQRANQAIFNLSSGSSCLTTAKPRKFSGHNVRSWIKSLQNIFESRPVPPSEAQK